MRSGTDTARKNDTALAEQRVEPQQSAPADTGMFPAPERAAHGPFKAVAAVFHFPDIGSLSLIMLLLPGFGPALIFPWIVIDILSSLFLACIPGRREPFPE